MDLRIIFCRYCGVRAWILNGDRTLFLNHLRHVHPRAS